VIALAWAMEKGAQIFYKTVSENLDDKECREMYADLVRSEDNHKNMLKSLYIDITGKDDIEGLFDEEADIEYMEGGIKLKEALSWAEGKDAYEVMDYLMAMESNSYDLYSKVAEHCDDVNKARVFHKLADEELEHLIRISELACKKM
jgi:rubrerythrin